MSYVKKHLKVRTKCLGDRWAELTLLENSGEFGSKDGKHKWHVRSYPTFLAEGVRMYRTTFPCDSEIEDGWYDQTTRSNVIRFRVGEYKPATKFRAKLWPKLKAAIEEYNRYGEEEYQKYLQKNKEDAEWLDSIMRKSG